MGRYWNTERFDGKFGFACQPSDDPEYFGMCEDQMITYECTEDTKSICWQKVDENYDILNVPVKERCYFVADQEGLEKLFDLYKWYAFVKAEDGMFDVGGERCKERFDGADLALNRIYLGVAILSEATDNDYFTLQAER